jgi:hypothetical protein
MTDYRIVSRHVRYWRGAVHRWSTVWRFTGTLPSGSLAAATTAIKTLEDAVGYKGVTGNNGGCYEVAIYDHATGGVPIDTTTYFDWTTPGSWIPYTSSGWTSTSNPIDAQAEVAMAVQWHAGLSVTGKPVIFRKWFHSVPVNLSTPPSVDLSAAQITSLQTAINNQVAVVGGLGAPMGTGGRLAATSCIVRPYFGNHQMPRGRRRKALVTAAGRYTGPAIQVPQID